MSSEQFAAVGAFLSGVASVITASWYVKRARKRALDECEKRIAEIDRALHEGIRIGRHEDPPVG